MIDRLEQIAAYLDGSLVGDARTEFEMEMERDDALAAQVRQWRANDAILQRAFPVEESPIDGAMLSRLGLANPVAERTPLSVAANDNRLPWGRAGFAGGAIAASLAVAFLLFRPAGTAPSDDPAFQAAMETLPSGETARLAIGDDIRPVLTFQAGDGRFCREYSGDNIGGGIACRTGNDWTIEAQSKQGAKTGTASEYQTAGGGGAASLGAEMDRLDASDPLSAEKEKILITMGWKK